VSAEFQSFFDEKLMLSGSYGLTFIITTDLGDKIQFELSTADMFGNPYAYKTWMRHS
jgi:hypothetical protein